MINNNLRSVKIFIKKFNLLFVVLKPFSNLIRIALDKRYLYHYLQGLITNVSLRNYLARIEANFFKSKKRFSERTDELRQTSYVENPIEISIKKINEINNSLKDFKCRDQANNSKEFFINSRPSDCYLAFYNETDLFKSKSILELAVNEKLIDL